MPITRGEAREYLKEGALFDGGDPKSVRQVDIVIDRALDRLNVEHDWHFYMKDYRINLYPVHSGLVTATLGSNTFTIAPVPTNQETIIGSKLRVLGQGDTLYTITAIAGDQITTLEEYRGKSGGAASGSAEVHYDVYEMPSGVRNVSMIYDDNYFGDITSVSNDAFQSDVRRVGAYANQPFTNTIVRHPVSGTMAMRFWPSPNTSGNMQMFGYRNAEKPTADSDVLDWDPEKDELLYAAMDYVAARLWFRGRDGGPALIAFARDEYELVARKYKSQDIPQQIWDDDGDVDLGLRSFPTRGNS